MFIEDTSLIIATKERLHSLRRFFFSIDEYIDKFNEILIIDSSSKIVHKKIIDNFSEYKNLKIINSEASSSLQRNIGIKNFNKNNKFVMFCDDDIIFHSNSFFNMDQFINQFPDNAGYGFNLLEKKNLGYLEKLKKIDFLKNSGFYHNNPGIVCQNGWHTKISNAEKNHRAMWLSTQACIYNSKYINNKTSFDINLGKYSYLEDLFFSYDLGKKGRLDLIYNATYLHPDNINRTSMGFGVKEVLNRYKFVKKNNLNVLKFFITIFLKSFITFLQILVLRINLIPKFFGNLFGIILCIIKLKK